MTVAGMRETGGVDLDLQAFKPEKADSRVLYGYTQGNGWAPVQFSVVSEVRQ